MKSSGDKFIVYALLLVLNLEGFEGSVSQRLHWLFRRSNCDDEQPCQAPRIRLHPKNLTIAHGGKNKLKCKATGNPDPTISWKKITHPPKDGTPVDDFIDDDDSHYKIHSETRRKNDRFVVSTLSFMNVHESDAVYACVATSQGRKVQSRSAFVTFSSDKAPFTRVPGDKQYKEDEKCFELPKNSICSKYLDPRNQIYTNHAEAAYEIKKTMLEGISEMLTDSQVSRKCRPYVLPFLCYYNFPYCIHGEAKPKQLCQQDCKRLSSQQGVCSQEFSKAKTDSTLSSLVPSSCLSLPLSNCTILTTEMKLVKKLLEENKRKPTKDPVFESIRLHIDSTVKEHHECFYKNGAEYRGTVNRTKTGVSCLYWKDVPQLNKNINHQYCRNPNGLDQPWCFVSSAGEYEFCDVPKCESTVLSSGRYQPSNILYTIIPCLFFALALSLAIIMLAWRRHKQHFYQSAPSSPKQVAPRVNPKIQELNREDLCDFRLLGDGNIGRVFTADYTGSKDGHTFTAAVAVKAIVEKASPKQIEDFVREAETRANFKHENVIALIGVISKEEPLSLIYEYTEFGDLHEYLLRHSPNYSDAHANDDCGPLEFSDLLAIATQIASGMSYLSTHVFIHKDLSARNCLVTDNGITKISDFSGLCDMYAGDYYRAPGRPPLPVRWMAPEAISLMKFTTSSDVWSYGILLWEIFSYGSRPFFGLSNYQAMQHILQNDLLPCPDDCPKKIFFTMTECWETEPDSRPTFAEIYNKLKLMNDLPPMHSSVPRVQYTPDTSMDAPEIAMHRGDIALMHPTEMSSIHSMSSTNRQCRRDIQPGAFSRSDSHAHSIQSRHSSEHSMSSNHHPGSMNSMGHSIPPSISSMPHSVPPSMMNRHHHPMRSAHHSLPRDGGYHSLGRDKNVIMMDGHYPVHNMGHRAMSVNSNHHNGSVLSNSHPMNGGYSSGHSYVPSYPPSVTGPPASSVFSRQSSSHHSSRAPSVKSHDSTPRMTIHL